MNCTRMLESKLRQFSSFGDISYFLNTSDANYPQQITKDFVPYFERLLDQALKKSKLTDAAILVRVIHYLIRQNQSGTMQMLVSCKLHCKFGLLLGYAFEQISARQSVVNSEADQLYVMTLNIIIEYAKHMNDHCKWLFQNMLQRFLEIISEKSVFYSIRIRTAELLLGIFCEDDRQVIAFFRQHIDQNEAIFDQLCDKAVQSLSQTGDFQLQESIIELIFRMWSTDVRKGKAHWLHGNQDFLTKFFAISYDKFDYGVRMFLNEVNSASPRRRVLTLYYKELQVGYQTLEPSNQWCNCVDFCYESKVLDVRYPKEELDGDHKCNWNLNGIRSRDLVSFHSMDNPSSRTIDLHLTFGTCTSQILNDFTIEDTTAKTLVLRFFRVIPLDAQYLMKFATTLFGSNFAEKRTKRSQISKPKALLIQNTEFAISQQSGREIAPNASFVSLTQSHGVSQNSQRQNSPNPVHQGQGLFRYSKPKTTLSQMIAGSQRHSGAQGRSVSDDPMPMPPARQFSKPSDQIVSPRQIERPFVLPGSQSDSQVLRENKMMNNLAMHAVNGRQDESSNIAKGIETLISSTQHTELPLQSGQQRNPTSRPAPGDSKHRFSDTTDLQSHAESSRFHKPTKETYRHSQKIEPPPKQIHRPSGVPIRRRENARPTQNEAHRPLETLTGGVETAESSVSNQSDSDVAKSSTVVKAVVHASSQEDFRPAKPPSQHKKNAKSSKFKETVAYSDSSLSIPKSKTTKLAKTSSTSERRRKSSKKPVAGRSDSTLHAIDENSGDAFREEKEFGMKSLAEMMKESGSGSMEWKDVIPETQAVLNTSANVTANTSADLMLQCLHGSTEEPRIKQKSKPARSSQRNKGSKNSPMVTVDFPRRVTRSQQNSQMLNAMSPLLVNPSQTGAADPYEKTPSENASETLEISPKIKKKTLNTASKVNSEFKADELWDKVIGKENKVRSSTFSAKRKKKRSLINIDITEQLDGPCSDSSQKLRISNDPVLKSVKKMPYAARFMKRPSETHSISKLPTKRQSKGQKKQTIVEIFKTDSETAKTTTAETSEQDDLLHDVSKNKKPRRRNKTALKDLNIDPGPGELEKARAEKGVIIDLTTSKKTSKRGKKKKREELPLPFEDAEEIPDIDNNNESMFQPIETVRDAGPEIQELDVLTSPEPMILPRRQSKGARLIVDSTEVSEFSESSKKKRPRVSFEAGVERNETKEGRSNKVTDRKKTPNRSKKARLFDSASSAASAGSSELSWIKQHKTRKLSTPKALKTYKGRKNEPLNLPSLDKLTKEQVWDGSSSSPNSPEVARSDVTNRSVLSGISRLQGLGCDLAFDDITSEMDQEESALKNKPSTEGETVKSLAEIAKNGWNDDMPVDEIESFLSDGSPARKRADDAETKPKEVGVHPFLQVALSNNQTPINNAELLKFGKEAATKPEKKLSLAEVSEIEWNELSIGEIPSFSNEDPLRPELSDEAETKPKEVGVNPLLLKVARSNNQTPVDTTEQLKIREKAKKKPGKRKAVEPSTESLATENTYFKSKKKLRMRTSDASSPSSHSHLNWTVSSHSDVELPKQMIRLVGRYIKKVNSNWNEGNAERDSHLQTFENQAVEYEKHHFKLVKKLKSLESEAQDFIEKFNSKIQTTMTEAAGNIMNVKSMHSDLRHSLVESNENQNKRMERLRNEISKELRDMIKNTD